MKQFLTSIIIVFLLCFSAAVFSQPLPCPPINSTNITGLGPYTVCDGGCVAISCTDSTSVKSTTAYTFSRIPYLPTSFLPGTTVLLGIDDQYSEVVPIPFPFCFYGNKYNECLLGANGEICFDISLAGGPCPWSIPGPIPTTAGSLNAATLNTIMGVYQDIDPALGGTISWATYGTAPCRTFVVSWNNVPYYNTGLCLPDTNTQQIVLYESTYAIDIFVKHKPYCTSWNGGWAILGLVDPTGANYNIPPEYNATIFSVDDSGYRFTPNGPASWTYKWTDPSGAVVGTTQTATVCPTVPTIYTVTGVASSNCDSFVVHSTVSVLIGGNPVITHTSFTNPSLCGASDGVIKLFGLVPGISDTIYYNYGGVPQPYIVQTSLVDSSLTISGLCAGIYDNIVVKVEACRTRPPAPITLASPSISISGVTVVNPVLCGGTGSLILNGLYPGKLFTVTYDMDGVPQPPATATSTGTGTVTLTGLCAGTYTNIIASFTGCATCTSPPTGPYTLTAPGISISSLTLFNPLGCNLSDGSIILNGLYPGQTYTVTFDSAGVALPPRTLTATTAGTVTISGLGGGESGVGIIYDNIVASFTNCLPACITPPAGPATLTTPPSPPINLAGAIKNPTQCGYCDGSITLSAVTPYSSDTITYSYNGVVQPPLIVYANADSSISLPGLCGGTYSNFTVKVNYCLIGVTGEAVLTTPKLHANFNDAIHLGCHGDTVDFTNTSYSPGASIPAVMNYKWDFGDGFSGAPDSSANPMHIYAQGSYTVTLTTDDHYCFSDTSVSISLVHPLQAGFTYAPAILCQDNVVTFTDTSIGNILSYQWIFGNGATANTKNASYNYKNSGVYNAMLVVSNFVRCQDTASVVVQVDSQSSVAINVSDSVICRSTDISFTGIYTQSGNTGITWYFGDGDSIKNLNPVIRSYDAAGIFTVTANAYFRACRDTSASRIVTVFDQPAINLGPADTTICIGSDPMVLSDKINTGNANASWVWSTGQTGPEITITAPGIYTATVYLYGCKSSYTVDVLNDCYMNIPNVFSPNGDGINDYFFPRTLLTSGLISFNMNIYNRWGELIYQSTSLDGRGWDGKFNSIDQPEGVYVYTIDGVFKDGQKKHHQGNVTLIR